MGKNNKARRAAKAKARHQRRGGSPPGWRLDDDWGRADEPSYSQRELVEILWGEVASAAVRSEPIDRLLAALVELPELLVDRHAERLLADRVAVAFRHGWQPAELARQARRATSSKAARTLIELAISAFHLDVDEAILDPRWRAQLDVLNLPQPARARGWAEPALAELSERDGHVAALADAMWCLTLIPPLDPLIPPPGGASDVTWPPTNGYVAADRQPDPIIERVRNLLAKAESTDFEAEAMAFTAKAQELMTRHAIDQAALGEGNPGDRGEAPVAARVFVDAPYADAKSLLLQIIAGESRCRSVFHSRVDLSTVVGFADDLAAVQLMFTSLLVQAQAALNSAARSAPPGTRTRSQSFRSAFYLAYANRIGERLKESNRLVTDAATAELGESFLPVLADRVGEVDAVFDERFSDLVNSRIRGGWDAAGFASGEMAADRAKLRFADLTDEAGGSNAAEDVIDLTEGQLALPALGASTSS